MRYRLEIKQEARKQLKALPEEKRRNLGRRLDALQVDLSGDVKSLPQRRMNIGCEWEACASSSRWKTI